MIHFKLHNISLTASHNGHIAVVKLLLERGAIIETEDKDGCTPLIYGICFNCLLKLNFILFCFKASANGHIEVGKLLVERGADIKSKDKNGFTSLIYGLFFNYLLNLNHIFFW